MQVGYVQVLDVLVWLAWVGLFKWSQSRLLKHFKVIKSLKEVGVKRRGVKTGSPRPVHVISFLIEQLMKASKITMCYYCINSWRQEGANDTLASQMNAA